MRPSLARLVVAALVPYAVGAVGCTETAVTPTAEAAPLGLRAVEPALAEAISIREELLAGRTLAELVGTESVALPTTDFAENARFRLLITGKKGADLAPLSGGLSFIAGLTEASVDAGDVHAAVVAATTAMTPVAARDDAGALLLDLARTLNAVGLANVTGLRESAGNTIFVETKAGAFYPAGLVAPLDDSEVTAVKNAALATLVAEPEVARNERIDVLWNDMRPAFDDGIPAELKQGNALSRDAFIAALQSAKYDELIQSRYVAAETLGETVGEATGAVAPKDVVRGEAKTCVTKTLFFCDDDGYDELGSYVSSFVPDGRVSPTRNKKYRALLDRSRAVAHTQMSHPRKTIGTAASLGKKDAGEWVGTYSGCGPENISGLIWRRWVNGDSDFNVDRGSFAPLPTATAGAPYITYTPASGKPYRAQPVPGNPANAKYTFLALAANEISTRAGAVAFDNGNVFASPGSLLGAANGWLSDHKSPLRLEQKFYYPLQSSGVAQDVNNIELAAILHQLVGLRRGPVMAAGDLGGGFFKYHYPPVFSYRITRTKSGKPVRVRISFDFKRNDPEKSETENDLRPYEIDLSDVLSPRGLFYFTDDRARTKSPDEDVASFCKGKADGAYCDPKVIYGGFTCKGGVRAAGLQCPTGKTCKGADPKNVQVLLCQ